MRVAPLAFALGLAWPGAASAEPAAWMAPLDLVHTAFAVPDGVPDAVVRVPEGFDSRGPLHVVVLLHGWSCCAASFVGSAPCSASDRATRGWNVARHHDRAGTNSILLAPQLAFLARDSSPGRFGERGFFRTWLQEIVQGPLATHLGSTPRVGSVTLVAHSAGYQTALAIVERGEVPVTNVVLLDALYSGTERFVAWLAEAPAFPRGEAPPPGGVPSRDPPPRGTEVPWLAPLELSRHLVSIHTRQRSTRRESALLARLVLARFGRTAVTVTGISSLRHAVASHRAVVAETPFGHSEVPARHMADVLASLGLPPRP